MDGGRPGGGGQLGKRSVRHDFPGGERLEPTLGNDREQAAREPGRNRRDRTSGIQSSPSGRRTPRCKRRRNPGRGRESALCEGQAHAASSWSRLMPYPRRRLQTSLSGGGRWIITAGPVFPRVIGGLQDSK